MELSQLFSSSAKYKVLAILSLRTKPIHLRAVAELADVSIRSVQVAINSLMQASVLTKSHEGNRTLYKLNTRSRYAPLLSKYFKLEEDQKLEARASKYKNAGTVLNRVNEILLFSWKSQNE